MKKKVLFIICMFLLTGCDAVYNLEIDNFKVNESTNIYFNESDYNHESYVIFSDDKRVSNIDELIDNSINEDYLAFTGGLNDKEYYNKKRLSDDDGKGINLNYSYKYDNYINSSLLNSCGKDVSFINDNKTLSLSVEFLPSCFMAENGTYLNNLTVNIKTNLKVSENNADTIDGNIYSWIINDDNYYDKNIKIVMKKSKNIVSSTDYSILFIVLFLILIIIVFLMLFKFLKKKYSDNNSF